MRADDEQRVSIARDYLAGIRQTGVEQLPPSRLMTECAESRRQLGIVLGVLSSQQGAARQLAEIRAVLAGFDWEFDDRQLALEAIERIADGGRDRRFDNELWTCAGCGGQMVGRRTASDLCRDCAGGES